MNEPYYTVRVEGDAPQIEVEPTSCHCGGDWAFLVRHGRKSCRLMMLGCVCHNAVSVAPAGPDAWLVSVSRT